MCHGTPWLAQKMAVEEDGTQGREPRVAAGVAPGTLIKLLQSVWKGFYLCPSYRWGSCGSELLWNWQSPTLHVGSPSPDALAGVTVPTSSGLQTNYLIVQSP